MAGSFFLLFFKGLIDALKLISKEEKQALVKEYPRVEDPKNKSVHRTMVQDSKRGHFYVDEHKWILDFLEKYWKSRTIERFE